MAAWCADDEADIDVGAVDPPENVVCGTENVGLPAHVTASEGVITREILPLRPHEHVEAASEHAILEGT